MQTNRIVQFTDSLFIALGLRNLVEDTYACRMARRPAPQSEDKETAGDNSILSLFNTNINVPVGGRVMGPEGDVLHLTI